MVGNGVVQRERQQLEEVSAELRSLGEVGGAGLGVRTCADPCRRRVEFRNFVVQRYDHVGTGILVEIVGGRQEPAGAVQGRAPPGGIADA